MRHLLFLSFVSFLVSAVAEPISSRITEVTVFADRARVTRSAEIKMQAEAFPVELTPLPAWVDPASMRARVSNGEVLDVQTRREFLSKTPDEQIRKAEEAVQEIQDQLAGIQDRIQALHQKKEQIQQARTFVTRELPPEISRRDIPVEYFESMADFVYKATLEIDQEKRELDRTVRDLQPELMARRNGLAELRRGNQLEQLIVTLVVQQREGAEKEGTLSVTYELPGATWEPVHDVRVTDSKQVRIVSLARVRQTSGEDWDGARLTFSTRNLQGTATLPQLEALLLGGGRSRAVNAMPAQGSASWSYANDYYLGNMATYNRAANKGALVDSQLLQANFMKQQEVQQRSTRVFKKLEGRGTTALYEAKGVYTVRTDGSSVRIPLSTMEREGDLQILAAPEVSPNAARGIELVYENPLPLLPGEAALFLDGAFIGNTQLDFTGPGESFTLFAGSEDSLKISRRLNHEESELRRGRKTNRMRVQYEITVENTGTEPLPLRLADRVPVSNERDIDVDIEDLDPDTEPDENGLLTWNTIIPPGTTQVFTLRYEVEYPSDLKPHIQRGQAGANAPQGVLRMEVEGVESMILDLESKF